jgi:AcrR family transcriptional regulator
MARPGVPASQVRLLAAAEAIFVEHGLDRARVEDITARAGLSKGAFYLHFDSKEGVFRHLVEAIIAEMATYVEAAIAEREDGASGLRAAPAAGEVSFSLRDHFERCLHKEAALFEFMWSRRACMRLLFEGGRSSSFLHLMDEFADRMRWRVMGSLRWGVERGIYKDDLDVEIASLFVAGAYDRLARYVVRQPEPPDFVALVRAMQRFVLGGLANDHVIRELEGRAPLRSQVAFG